MQTTWIYALSMGLFSACSLPLGSLITFFWTPSQRVIAFFMAFGGGALLAALTIELVAGTLQAGQFNALALGCTCGGLLFIGLNEVVNDFGAFLRKSSTRLYHLRKKEHKQFKQIIAAVQRIDIFDELSDKDLKALAASIQFHDVKKNTMLYRRNDPAEDVFIIEKGTIELIDPSGQLPSRNFTEHGAFGWMAFMSGSPYRYNAQAKSDATIWQLPRYAFLSLLPNSPTLLQAVHKEMRSTEVSQYLVEEQGLSPQRVKQWNDDAVHSLLKRGIFHDALPIQRNCDVFLQHLPCIERASFFKNLPANEINILASRLIYKTHKAGETFFVAGELADRMYFINQGTVNMLDAANNTGSSINLSAHSAFGFMAFITGMPHSMSALATSDTEVWVLRKQDFNDLIKLLPEFRKHVDHYIQHADIENYLTHQSGVDGVSINRWKRMACVAITKGLAIPSLHSMLFNVQEHKAKPLAIWLGLLLDGIPEALVIGANISVSHIGLSLLAGLFLSNFPEALSSSVDMRQHGMKGNIIMLMWCSLMLMTGIIAAMGSLLFVGLSPATLAFTEGVAAGSMLTMIAQTMLPEAYLKGGGIVGFSTLLGFLCAIFFKTLE